MAPNRWALLNFRATNQNDLDSCNEILESFGVSLSPNPSPSTSAGFDPIRGGQRRSVEASVNNAGGPGMSEQNKALAARIPLEAFNQGKLEVIDEVIAHNSVDHAALPPGIPPGNEGIKLLAKALRSAFPDFKITIKLQIAEGDLVVSYATATGTMKGEFAGMPPSGKTATWEGIHITRIKDGKVVEHWAVEDRLVMLQQLGFMPTPAAPPAR